MSVRPVKLQIRNPRTRNARGMVVALGMVPLLAGCSSVPDAVNPVEWYRGTVDYFSDDTTDAADADAAKDADADVAAPGADDDFPNVASVPERPQANAGANVADGLIADPNRPRYAPAVARQGDAQNALNDTDADANAVAATQPAPPAVPAAPVVSATAPAVPNVGDTAPAAPVVVGGEKTVAAVNPNAPALPAILQDDGSKAAFDAFRKRLLSGATTGASVPSAYATAPQGAVASGPLPTVVISGDGVAADNAYGVAGGGVAAPSMPGGTLASGFKTVTGAGVAPGSVKVATILFGNGSRSLDGRDRSVLKKVADLYREKGGVVRVIGHASSRTRTMDPIKHKLTNYQVSASRADMVASTLVDLGVPRDAILVGAVSDSQPLFYEVMPSGEAGNRRAEVYIDT